MKLNGAYELLKMINDAMPVRCRVSLSLTPTVYDMTDDIELTISTGVNGKHIGWMSILPTESLEDDELMYHHARSAIERFNAMLQKHKQINSAE